MSFHIDKQTNKQNKQNNQTNKTNKQTKAKASNKRIQQNK
jgi:hypothetical protein